MNRIILAVYDFLSRRKGLAVILMLLMLALCVLLSLRLRYKENVSDFLPQNEDNRRYTSVYNELGDQGEITVIFRPSDSLLAAEESQMLLMDAIDRFATFFDSLAPADLTEVTLRSQVDDGRAFEAMDFIRSHQPLFLTDSDYDRIDSLLALPGYVDTCLHNVHRMMAFPLGSIVVDAIANDPLNLFSPSLQRLSSLSTSDRFQVVDGYLFDADGNAYAFLTSPFSSSDTRGNSHLSEWLNQVLLLTRQQCPEVKVSAVGSPLIAATNANQIKHDSLVSMLMAVVLIMAILFCIMGRRRNIFWLVFSILFGWIVALAVIALFKPSISIIVIGIGSVLLGIAVNYPLHFLDHICHHPDRRAALKDMIDPLVTGNITTVSAFACLIFVRAEAMRDLGLFGALMLVGTIFFVMVFLPLFAKGGCRKGKAAMSQAKATMESENTFTPLRRRLSATLFGLVCLVTLLLGILSTHTSFDSDLHNINYMTEEQKADLQLLSRGLEADPATSMVYVVSESPSLELALNDHVSILETLHNSVGAGNGCASDMTLQVSGPTDLLPTLEQQRQRLLRWHDFVAAHPQLLVQLQQAARREGFTSEAFAPFVAHIRQSYDTFSVVRMECLQSLCTNYLLRADSTERVVSFVRVDTAHVASVKQLVQGRQIDDVPQHVESFAFDISDVGSNLVSALNDDFNYILFVCSFVVFFFLWLSLGRLELALLSFIPLTVGWLWILGLMDLFAVKFNIVNIILATFIFGQGDDYTIFITEGLMHEYAYGRKRLRNYRRSVIISALLMFVGIGVLIFAKHPAMRSLAEVAFIGMATVLLMACYLPPLVFRWLTTSKGQLRYMPLTLKRLLITFWVLLVFVVAALVVITPYTFIYKLIGRDSEAKRLRFHRLICRFSGIAVRHLPGVDFRLYNPLSESFDKPAVIVANHQSHLDLLCILSLTPKLVILTNDWVWRNPIYGVIIRYAEFYPVSNGFDNNLPKLKALMERGYSVMIFPEGTRSVDGCLGRFHKGAFQLAQQCGTDLLPVYLHGTNHVMPKSDLVLREGAIDVEVGQRISYESFAAMEAREVSFYVRDRFMQRYRAFSAQLEDEHYFLPLLRHQYLYKGRDIARRSRRIVAAWLKGVDTEIPGQGEIPMLKAWAHPEQEFEYLFDNEDDYLVASHCPAKPANLHYHFEPPSFFSLTPEGDNGLNKNQML